MMPRLWTAMITPYDKDLQVDYNKAGEIAEYLANNGTGGLILSGTTGESPVLTKDEQIRLFTEVKAKVGHRMPIWGGTGSNDTAHVIDLSQAAEKAGVDGLLLVTPYYNKPNQEGLYQHFKAVAEAVSLPIMLYNVPPRTNVNLLPATIARLAEIENIVAVKEASGDMDQISLLKNSVPPEMCIFSGDDSMTLPMLAIGAHGVVSVASHIAGLEISAMLEAYVSGDIKKAQELHLRLYPMFKGLFITANPIPVKAALNLIGMEVGGLRLPLVEADLEQLNFINKMLVDYKLIG